MSFTILEGHKQLINATALNSKQFAYVNEIIEFCKGVSILTQPQLREAAKALRGTSYAPWWIIKNHGCRDAKHPHMFNLSKFKLSAADAKKALAGAPATETTLELPAPAAPAKQKKGKIEAKATRKGGKKTATVAAPAAAEPATPAAETEEQRDAREERDRQAAIDALMITA